MLGLKLNHVSKRGPDVLIQDPLCIMFLCVILKTYSLGTNDITDIIPYQN